MNANTLIRIVLYIFVAAGAYLYLQPSKATQPLGETNYREKGYIKAKERYLKYSVYENGEVKPIADMLARGCNADDACEIGNIFHYVLHLPYKESQGDRDPSAVINQNGGDCDEKAYLFASLLIQRGHECVLVITNDHAFIAVHLQNDRDIPSESAYLEIGGKKYYYAETSAEGSEIGRFNGFGSDQIESVFDIVHKREIPLDTLSLHIFQER